MQKYYQLPILGTLDTLNALVLFSPLPSKTIMSTCSNFDIYLHGKNEAHP